MMQSNIKFKGVIFVLLILVINQNTFCQGLDKICPVILQQGNTKADISFVLTTTDYNFARNRPARYENSIQIIDVNQPWPPRWFSAMEPDTTMPFPYGQTVPINASYQNKQFTYFTVIKVKGPANTVLNKQGFVICNPNLQPVDTLMLPNQEIEHHELRIAPNGDKIFFVMHDSVVDMRAIHHLEQDSALKLSYENIVITDAKGKIVFTWDPIKYLGADAQYPAYFNEKGMMRKPGVHDWGHGNSVCFDYDGDILYSYKLVGIGKISRKDGHVIWRIDRNNQQPNSYSDTIPFYLQHDFKSGKDAAGKVFYSFYSNGDAQHKTSIACQFSVKDTLNGVKAFKILKKHTPPTEIKNSNGLGNYDVEANGNYLINYGAYRADTSNPKTCFEYRDVNNKILSSYALYPFATIYRAHKLDGWRPARPVIKLNGKVLSLEVNYPSISWYELNSKEQIATQVFQGKEFNPSKAGVYCAVVASGFGYAVSEPFNFAGIKK